LGGHVALIPRAIATPDYYYHFMPVPEETITHSPILITIQPLSASSIYYDP